MEDCSSSWKRPSYSIRVTPPKPDAKWDNLIPRATGEDPGKGWNHVVQNLQKSWRFLSRDILRKAKTKWRRRGSKTPVKEGLTLYTRQR